MGAVISACLEAEESPISYEGHGKWKAQVTVSILHP